MSENPYQTPETATAGAPAVSLKGPSRPISPMIFGVLAIFFGVMGLLSTPLSLLTVEMQRALYEKIGYNIDLLKATMYVGIFFSLWLLVAGIGLVRYRRWGQIAFLLYCGLTIVFTLMNSTYVVVTFASAPDLDAPVRWGGLMGAVFSYAGLIYPILGLIFLNLAGVKEAMK